MLKSKKKKKEGEEIQNELFKFIIITYGNNKNRKQKSIQIKEVKYQRHNITNCNKTRLTAE